MKILITTKLEIWINPDTIRVEPESFGSMKAASYENKNKFL